MREILFRGALRATGEWSYGNLDVKVNGVCIITPDDTPFGKYGQVIPETVGQYTGLTDSNGEKIFEGDIIRYADEDEYRMYLESLEYPEEYEGVNFNDLWTVDEVVYGIEIGYPAFDLNNHEWECNGLSNLNESCQYFYEVIGNIYDNPELLKGGADNGNL